MRVRVIAIANRAAEQKNPPGDTLQPISIREKKIQHNEVAVPRKKTFVTGYQGSQRRNESEQRRCYKEKSKRSLSDCTSQISYLVGSSAKLLFLDGKTIESSSGSFNRQSKGKDKRF
jgi:hypothetical protein